MSKQDDIESNSGPANQMVLLYGGVYVTDGDGFFEPDVLWRASIMGMWKLMGSRSVREIVARGK